MLLYLYKYGELNMVISGDRSDVDHWKDSYERIVLYSPDGEEEFIFSKEITPELIKSRDGH